MTAVLRLVCLLLWPGIAVAQPVEIGHVWGTTRIEARPERIVTLSYNGADNWLALGVRPMAYRVWYGGDETRSARRKARLCNCGAKSTSKRWRGWSRI